MDIQWKAGSIGYSSGVIQTLKKEYVLNDRTEPVILTEDEPGGGFDMHSETGKLADSEDSFLYIYIDIDPRRENFDVSAKFEVLDLDGMPTNQTGYGILAADTAFSGKEGMEGRLCRHRNHLLLGRFRTVDGQNHGYGLRAVGGYTSKNADEYAPVRLLDPTRVFPIRERKDRIVPGDICTLRLIKTDDGFEAFVRKGETEEKIIFPGCDFLMKQDAEKISVGFAVAGKLRVQVSDIQFTLSEGVSSTTPDGTIRCFIPDYPFTRDLFDDNRAADTSSKRDNAVIYVSPDGTADNDGTEAAPTDIYTAFDIAGEGSEIILSDGTYRLVEPLYLPSHSGGTFQNRITVRAQHEREVMLDGSRLQKKAPLMIIRGRYWIIEGIVFKNSPLSGVMICGSGNLVHNCEACQNGDTGILICAYPGEAKDNWPSYNQIDDCDAYDNCDPARSNADGFGAKLRIGKGNGFYRCTAHHNIDDGFDLYTKSIFGPTEPVLLEQCIAYENGRTAGDRFVRKNHAGGVGFKLGGERQSVAHQLWDCIAYKNNQYDFSANSNPIVSMHRCSGSRKKQLKDKKKSILMMISLLGGGGAERVTSILASEFSKKHSVCLLYMFTKKEQSYKMAPEVKVIDGSWSQGTFLQKYFHIPFRWPFRIYSIISTKMKYHVDVTISMLHMPNKYNGLIPFGRKLVSERNDISRKSEEERRDAYRSYPRADHVVFQSEYVKSQFPEKVQAKSSIIRNPIGVSCFADKVSENRIVTVGRYIEQKNHELLIRAFAVFHREHPSYTLHLYGEGPLEDQYQALIEELDIEDAVFLEGFKDPIHEHLRNAKMFVLSSDYEGMSNALMEAMMMGLPCISTSCTGSNELLEDGKNGLLVPVGDTEALVEAMSRVADDEELCSRLRDQAQLSSLEFEKEKVIRAWERIMFH